MHKYTSAHAVDDSPIRQLLPCAKYGTFALPCLT